MALAPGTRIGSYEVGAVIGAGGMGEVYRARDVKLGRAVALKMLPEALAGDSERVARLRREAQLLASLNHPHIAAIYGLEEAGAAQVLVMELVEGGTLADRLGGAALPFKEALPIALQVCDALEAAHERGIVHRDLKPANIAFTPDGQVKVLDFGLARANDPGQSAEISMSPTLSLAATQAGVILGTAAYMSPEQAKGRVADKRSDVWAFGCVFYEMLTGRRAFDGEDLTDTIAAVVRGEPDWALIPQDVPAHVRDLLKQCLQKDRRQRISDIAVARYVLGGHGIAPASSADASALQTVRQRRTAGQLAVAAAALAIAALALVAAGVWTAVRWLEPAPPQVVRFAMPSGIINPSGPDRDIAISPDGSNVVYRSLNNGIPQLVVRPLNQLEVQPLTGTDNARWPFFSPDGKSIAYFANSELRRVSVAGGPSVKICTVAGLPRGGSWGDNDTILFATNNPTEGLRAVPAGGGELRVVAKSPDTTGLQNYVFPFVLPGSRTALITIYSGQPETGQIAALDLQTGTQKILVSGGSQPGYVASEGRGYLVYASVGSIRAVNFDASALEVSGNPMPVEDRVMTSTSGAGEFAVSQTGTLVIVPGNANQQTTIPRSLVWVDRQGREQPLKLPTRTYGSVRLSPDGRRAAVGVYEQGGDIWIVDLDRDPPPLQKLTTDVSPDMSPVWGPDNRSVFWAGIGPAGSGVPNVFRQPADGIGKPERLSQSNDAQFPTAVTNDGKQVVIWEAAVTGSGNYDISLINVEPPSTSSRQSTRIVDSNAAESNPDLSADNRWLAYQSNESGAPEIYVKPFPNVDDGRVQISIGGGTRPAWSRSGSELFYIDADGFLTSVPIQIVESTVKPGRPVKLLSTRYYAGTTTRGPDLRGYDVTADGQRFLMIKDAATNAPGTAPQGFSLEVTINWIEELKQRVPVK